MFYERTLNFLDWLIRAMYHYSCISVEHTRRTAMQFAVFDGLCDFGVSVTAQLPTDFHKLSAAVSVVSWLARFSPMELDRQIF
jgi:hypothetical protein